LTRSELLGEHPSYVRNGTILEYYLALLASKSFPYLDVSTTLTSKYYSCEHRADLAHRFDYIVICFRAQVYPGYHLGTFCIKIYEALM
jgi:hypothetical protein